MNRIQFSLTGLIIAVVVLAIACAAITSGLAIVASAVHTLQYVLLGLGIVGIVARRGADRVFWVGFVVFGYLYSSATEQPQSPQWFWFSQGPRWSAEDGIITDRLLQFAFTHRQRRVVPAVGTVVEGEWMPGAYFQAKVTQVASDGSMLLTWLDGSAPTWVPPTGIRGNWLAFRSTGHGVFGILSGLLGGYIASIIFSREKYLRKTADQKTATGVKLDETSDTSK